MKITLQIHLGLKRQLEEAALQTPLAPADLALLKKMPYLAGVLRLEHPEQREIVFDDDLGVIVPELCLTSRAKLAEEEAVTVPLTTEAEQIVLNPAGDTLQLDVSSGAHAAYPREEALAELLACGQKFIHFVELNFGDNEHWMEQVAYWKSQLPKAELPAEEAEYEDPNELSVQPDNIPEEYLEPEDEPEKEPEETAE